MTADEAGAMAEEILHTVTSDVMNGFDPVAKAVLADAWTRLHATLASQLAPAELVEMQSCPPRPRNVWPRDIPNEVRELVQAADRLCDEWNGSDAKTRERLWDGVHLASEHVWGLLQP